MLYFFATILAVLWMLGLVTTYTVLGFFHVTLAIAVAFIVLRFIGVQRAS